MDPLSHLASSLLLYKALGGRRKLVVAVASVFPDVDALISLALGAPLHRSITHSLLLYLPLLLGGERMRTFAAFAMLHVVTDLFFGQVPLLYPLVDRSFSISVMISLTKASVIAKAAAKASAAKGLYPVGDVVNGYGLSLLVMLLAAELAERLKKGKG